MATPPLEETSVARRPPSEPVDRLGRALVVLVVLVLFAKLGGLSSPGYGPPRWAPWTWRPGPLFRATLTTGGDTGAHVWAPAFMREHLVPAWRPTGWSNDWYAGFPVLSFYFPLPMWTIVALGTVLGNTIAFKLVSVSGLIALPLAAGALARLAELPRLYQYLFVLGGAVFVVDPHYDILGGNALSTMAGEFSFTISLCFGLLFLGLLHQVLRTGRQRGAAVAMAVATSLSHLLPTMFVAVSTVFVVGIHLFARCRPTWPSRARQIADVIVIGGTTLVLGAFWLVPFAANIEYTNDMGWERGAAYLAGLFPPLADEPTSGAAIAGVVVLLGLLGGAASAVRFVRAHLDDTPVDPVSALGATLLFSSLASAAAFRFTPQFRLLNERALPFYFLGLSLLAPLGLIVLGRAYNAIAGRLRPGPALRLTPRRGLALTALLVWWGPGFSFGVLPGWVPVPKSGAHGLGFQRASSSDDVGFAGEWANYNYNGYQDLGADWLEYKRLMDIMGEVGRRHGCGRALWDYEDQLDRYGTSLSMMLLPLWTGGCIGSMEGLYFESSPSAPYHFVNAALLSGHPSNPERGLDYPALDVAEGVRKLQQWGVRYYMVFTPAAQRQARTNPSLRLVDRVPYKRECTSDENKSGACPTTWEIYQVVRSELVEGLRVEPAVVTGIGQSQTGGWLDVAALQYRSGAEYPVPLAADGPRHWQRVAATVSRGRTEIPFGSKTTIAAAVSRPLDEVVVTGVVLSDAKLSFRVDRTGVPVVVKVSYYPNWTAHNADGPYRLAPNLMVVVPRAREVTLEFTRGRPETLGLVLSGGGAIVFAALALTRSTRRVRARRRRRIARQWQDDPTETPGRHLVNEQNNGR